MSKKKKKASSVMPMLITVGLFLGLGLGAIMDQLILVSLISLAICATIAWRIDQKAGVTYTRGKHPRH